MADWAKLKVVDLKAELKRRELPTQGLKAELVARLEAADEEATQTNGATEQAPVTEEAQAVEEPPAPAEDAPEEPEPAAAPEPEIPKQPVESEVIEPPPFETEDAPIAAAAVVDAAPQEPLAPIANADSIARATAEQTTATQATPHETVPTTSEVTNDPAPQAAPESTATATNDDTVMGEAGSLPPVETVESTPDAQSRKRRSASPPPNEEAIARKRARADEGHDSDIAPAVRMEDQQEPPAPAARRASPIPAPEPAKIFSPERKRFDMPIARNDSPPRNGSGNEQEAMDFERDVAPAIHPATSALYISNLMRPLRPNDMKSHLIELASPLGGDLDTDVIVKFHIDQIRTHAFVIFTSTSAASRVRSSLHDLVWPNESNRKALWVDFVPPEKVDEWIGVEESNATGRIGSRWEVVYDDGPDGGVEARLVTTSMSASRSGPPPPSRPTGPTFGRDSINNIPIGPRGSRDLGPPTGPRSSRHGAGPGPNLGPGPGPGPSLGTGPAARAPPADLSDFVEQTRARPTISFQLVTRDLADRRIDNMRRLYTKDPYRNYGREINRYSFEMGDTFVDRGKEIFEGIRPPHRERERRGGRGGGGGGGGGRRRGPRRGGGGGGGGGGGFRPRSDRYLPDRGDRSPRFDGPSDGRLPPPPEDDRA